MSFLRNCASNFFMTGEELLEQLLGSFQSSYDIERKRRMGGEIFDAYASFRAASAKYVLIERAELWRAECFEHVLFCVAQTELTPEDIERFRHTMLTYMEPKLVRHEEKYPPKDHMYTYMTMIYICESGVSKEAKKRICSFRYVKNYMFTIRGYSEARILVFDLKSRIIFGNRAAGKLVKGYKKSGILTRRNGE